MKPIALLIPEGVNIEGLVDVYAPDLDKDYLKYLIHYVLSKQSNGSNERPTKGYISISSKKLLVSNQKHRKHIEFLCSKEVDLFDRRPYCTGKCFSYRITPQYQNNALEVHYLKAGKLAHKIINSETKLPPILRNNSSKYHFLRKFFDRNNLSIDVDSAIQLCHNRFLEHKEYLKYVSEMTKIVELYNGEYKIYFKKNTDGRLHSNITNLPKVYREFVTYKDEPLVEVDLSNSIIYFLAIIINHSNKEYNIIKEDIIARIPLLYMFSKALKTLDNKEKELLWNLSISGDFYSSFLESFDQLLPDDVFKKLYERDNEKRYTGDREQRIKVVKKQILSMLFAKPKSYKKVQSLFGLKFPQLLKGINDFKILNGHKKFSHLLLQSESIIMLDVVAKDYNRKHWRKAPTITLHDCIITTQQYLNKLLESMETSFSNAFGIAPRMVSKEWRSKPSNNAGFFDTRSFKYFIKISFLL